MLDSLLTARILLLVNYRPEYQHGWGAKTYYIQLQLDPLTPVSADAFLQALLGNDPGLAPLKQFLIACTQGNPFFLAETLRTLVETGVLAAERGVLLLANPGLPFPSATTTLSANIQVVLPGEIARAHRRTAAALRLIIESQGGYTVVNGQRIPMLPSYLVLTPNWPWHDHANDSDAPMTWLDGLDSPLIRLLECGFRENTPPSRSRWAREPTPPLPSTALGGYAPPGSPRRRCSTSRYGTTRSRRRGKRWSGWRPRAWPAPSTG